MGISNIDPTRAWDVMMAHEKPGGHGERSVGVGTLDLAIWDAAAKIASRRCISLAEHAGKQPPQVSPGPMPRRLPVSRGRSGASGRRADGFRERGLTLVKMKVVPRRSSKILTCRAARDGLPERPAGRRRHEWRTERGCRRRPPAEALRRRGSAVLEDAATSTAPQLSGAVTPTTTWSCSPGEAMLSAGTAWPSARRLVLRPD